MSTCSSDVSSPVLGETYVRLESVFQFLGGSVSPPHKPTSPVGPHFGGVSEFLVSGERQATTKAARRQRSTAPVSGIWAARRARAQRGPAQCSTWPSQVVSWAHRAHGSVAQRCPARTTMRRGPAGLPPGDQLLGCLGALAVRDV